MPDDASTPMSVVMAEEIMDANADLVAHHIAWGHERAAGWVRSICNGIPIPGSPQAHNASNAVKAAQVAGISRDEVAFLARRNADQLVALFRSLTDEDFRKSVPFGPSGGRRLSIDGLGRSHLDRHLASMRASLRR